MSEGEREISDSNAPLSLDECVCVCVLEREESEWTRVRVTER